MPLATDKKIHIKRADDGFSLQASGASSQRVNGTGPTLRTFNNTAARFGPFEPGVYEVSCVGGTIPGLTIFSPPVIKIGGSTVTSVRNADHIPAFKTVVGGVATLAGVSTSLGLTYCSFEVVFESAAQGYISMVAAVSGDTTQVVASFQRLR